LKILVKPTTLLAFTFFVQVINHTRLSIPSAIAASKNDVLHPFAYPHDTGVDSAACLGSPAAAAELVLDMDADILCVDVREYGAHICVAIFFDAAQTGFATREDFIGTQAAPFTPAESNLLL